MRSLAASLVLAILVASCGGGGGDSGQAPAPIPPPRHDILYGYFGDCDGCIAETRDHTNLVMIEGWGAEGAMLRHAAEAVGAGQKILLAVCWRCGEANIRWTFDQLRLIGALSSVVALYPQDEPTQAGLTEGQIRQLVEMVRAVALDYPEINPVKIAVIYGQGDLTGAAYFDWIGRDCYGCGGVPVVPLLPHQRLLIVPGGADPWRESPDSSVAYANAHPEVVAIIPFIWRDPNTLQGIATNGMAPAYRAAGKAVTGR